MKWTRKWEGGRVREDGVFVIEKMRGGRRYNITLGIDEKAAKREFFKFDDDPEAYAAQHQTGPTPIAGIDADLVNKFIDAKLTGERPISKNHALDLHCYLQEWVQRLKGRDLSRATLLQYNLMLEDLEPRRKYIIALRSYTKWLRKTGRLSSTSDASQDLDIPQVKVRRAQKGFELPSIQQVETLFRAMRTRPHKLGGSVSSPNPSKILVDAQTARDVLVLRVLTGLHGSEIERIALGEADLVKVEAGAIYGTVLVLHKTGIPHMVSLNQQAYEAAARLQATGHAPDRKTILRIMHEAATDSGVKYFSAGVLRHFFITTARKHGQIVRPGAGGLALEDIAAVVGHRSVSTTNRYNDDRIPPMIVLPIRLYNPEDPQPVATLAAAAP